jgi:energy-converting hydrogenase Eha subunit E
LGKPSGTLQSSIYDQDRQRIVELLNLELSVRGISKRHLAYGSISSLNYYVRIRKLRFPAR